MALDSVTAIARSGFAGWVYNFTTDNGWYFADSIVTHNCDCRTVMGVDEYDWPEGYDPTSYAQTVNDRDRARIERQVARGKAGHGRPGPKTGQEKRRNRSAQAWGDRQRIKAERDAAKKRLARAQERGDAEAEANAREVLDRTAAERDRLNGNT